MGYWGRGPWENDRAGDYTSDALGALCAHVLSTLRENDGAPEEYRAAARLVVVLYEAWDTFTVDEAVDAAIRRLAGVTEYAQKAFEDPDDMARLVWEERAELMRLRDKREAREAELMRAYRERNRG